jgi:hypothetical protein
MGPKAKAMGYQSEAPGSRGFLCFWFYFIKLRKTNGQVFGGL